MVGVTGGGGGGGGDFWANENLSGECILRDTRPNGECSQN